MEKALEQALDHAESVIESAWQKPPKRRRSSSGGKSLHEKLYDLYVEECGKEPGVTKELISNVNLLEKLVQRESLPCLVVNLYPGKQGYSLMLKGPSESHSETIRLPYEERAFLEYLDAEELPPALVDLLEKSELNMFHSGCVIAEVRDYRQGGNAEPPGYQSRHILLRPTMQTLACDVHSIASDKQEWTQEDKLLLESQLILATAEPLCLDPSVSVACTANRLLYNRQKMNTLAMKRNLKRNFRASLNEAQEPSCSLDPHKKSKVSPAAEQNDVKISKAGKCVDMWKQRPCDLAVPSEVDVEKYAREVRSVQYDDSPRIDWPAYGVNDDISLFGCEAGDQSQTTELTFMQSLGDPLISGQTLPKKARCERQMSPCHFFEDDHCYSSMHESVIDTGEEVQNLFEELEPLSVQCAFEVSSGSSGSGSLSQLSPEKEAAQPLDISVQSSVLEEGVQHTPPTISLLSSSGKSSSGSGSLSPQQESNVHKSVSPAPAPKPPSLSQKSSVEVNPVSIFPTATLFTASSAQITPASQVQATYVGPSFIQVAVPVHVAQTVVRGSSSTKGFTARVRTPVPIKPKIPSSEDQQLPNVQPAVPQAPSQGIQFVFQNVSEARPITLLQLPPGTLILNSQQQSQQQPQQQPQQKPQQQQPCQQPQQPQQQPQQQPREPQQEPRQQPQQPQQQPQQQPREPRQEPQQQPRQQPWQPQWQPLQQPWQQVQEQPQQWPQQQVQQQPQQWPQQRPQQQQPQQRPQQRPQQQPWKPQQQPQQQPRQKLQKQPRQPRQVPRQQPRQVPRQQPRLQPRQPQQQPQQPQQPQQQPQQPQQPQQQPQQLQQQPQQQPWQQPQQFYQLIPQLQQPIYHIQQSVSQHSSVQRPTHRRMILPAQKTAIANPKRLRSNLQPQRVMGSQPSSTQTGPGQSHSQQSAQLPSAFQQQPQPQQVQLRILQLPVPVPTVATQRAQPHHGQKAESQSKGKMN
ncbi:transcription factor SPT20 homolog [Phyllostomus discolor]|uniref:Transcription factor SPT20 homolog n=1 Tax=Phyllostomus discolor TaxID=89673 RepID=A0A7E6D372_9CHIR|nr:transcription factor SPT20 homolog [Phyllostomus discolor]